MHRVLIVDDASTVRLYYREVLTSPDLLLDEAVNGLEALEKALSMPYDLYLVDVNMPTMDGYRFLAELRGHTEMKQAPAIMISTESATHDAQAAYRAGANLYLVKPVRPEELTLNTRLLLGAPL
ncbi:response regulator [Chitinimonas lacunae]|uniref:PleD family two-component system response regulator n=1 Tax=Chitinimonas lacunae TaxID=1963018 RepID=A0ABV8MM16_9NEIS